MSKPRNRYTPESRAQANYYRLGGYAFFSMKRYLNDMVSLFKSHRYKLQESHKEELEKFPLYPHIIDSAYENRYRDLDIYFARILLNSSFIASFSIFEIMFKEVCYLAAYKFSRQVEFDFNTGVERCSNYLKGELRLDLSDLSEFWNDLLKYRELRNSIVHHNSRIVKNTARTIAFLKKLEHVRIKKIRNKEEYVFVIVDRQFINEFLDSASEYLANILLKLPKGRRKAVYNIKRK
jgi:hypothetical protein